MARILIVEDEPELATILRLRLEREGWEVVTASDGETAFQATAASPPDLVLLDISLPGMDGFEVLEKLRKAHGFLLPVVMLTATGTMTAIEKARQLQVSGYIMKPFDPELVVSTIRRLLKLAAA